MQYEVQVLQFDVLQYDFAFLEVLLQIGIP